MSANACSVAWGGGEKCILRGRVLVDLPVVGAELNTGINLADRSCEVLRIALELETNRSRDGRPPNSILCAS